MVKLLFIGVTLVLVVGVIRRWFFRGAWRVIVPLVLGFFIGVPLSAKTVGIALPPHLRMIPPMFISLVIGCGLMGILEEILGPPKDRK